MSAPLRDRLAGRAFLFDHPGSYLAGVDAALHAIDGQRQEPHDSGPPAAPHRATGALGVSPPVVDHSTAAWRPDTGEVVVLAEGMTVCFTGSATYPDGSELPRKRLNEIAAGLGLVPTTNVTKKGCHVLVAADTASQSGKAGKARNHGIPLIDVHDFVQAQPGSPVPAVTMP